MGLTKWYEEMQIEGIENTIRCELKQVSQSFVVIGYYLKDINRRKLYRDAGFDTIWDYAQDRFNISRSNASRYMAINDQFSADGNSPVLLEEYKEYGSSQLQEMLTLPQSKLKEIKPEMTVKEIRQMKKPEAPKAESCATPHKDGCDEEEAVVLRFTLENGKTIGGAYGASWAAIVREYCTILHSQGRKPNAGVETLYISAMGHDCEVTTTVKEAGFWENKRLLFLVNLDRLQQEYDFFYPAEKVEEEQDCPIDISSCIRQEWGTEAEEQEAGRQECKKCWSNWKTSGGAAKHTLGAKGEEATVRPEGSLITTVGCGSGAYDCFSCGRECSIRQKDQYCVMAPLGNPYSCETMKLYGRLTDEMGNSCMFVDLDLADTRPGDKEPSPCCRRCKNKCEYACVRAVESVRAEVNTYTPRYLLAEEQEKLNEILRVNTDPKNPLPEKLVARQKIVVAALTDMVKGLDKQELEEAAPEQPELLMLKNNDQRKEFIGSYPSWPIWIDQELTGEKFYRYDLTNAVAVVVKVSKKHLWDPDSYCESGHIGYGAEKYYLLGIKSKYDGKGSHHDEDTTRTFYECETNMSSLVEYLKEFQKRGRD